MADETKKEVAAETAKTATKTAKTEKKKPNKFVGFFKKIGKFFKECKVELKKIVWASPSATTKNTILVTVAILLFAAIFLGLDTLFNALLNRWLPSIPRFFAGWFKIGM